MSDREKQVAEMAVKQIGFLTTEKLEEGYLIKNMSSMESQLTAQKKMNNVKDIRGTIDNLIQVANLLEVADKASEKFHVNVEIKDMTVKYQSLIGEIRTELKVFRMKSHFALQKHADAAMLLLDEGSTQEEIYEMLPDAIEEFASCIDIAQELQATAERLSGNARELEGDSRKALASAGEQDVKNEELKRNLIKTMQNAEARKKKQALLAKEYKKEVEEYSQKEKDAMDQAKDDADRAFQLQMVGLITNAVGGAVSALNPLSALADVKKEQLKQDNASGGNTQSAVAAAEEEKRATQEKKKKLEGEVEELDEKIQEMKDNQEDKEKIAALEKKKKAKEEAVNNITKSIKGFEAKIDQMAEQASTNAQASRANARRLAELRSEKRQLEIENAAALAETAETLSNLTIEVGEVRTAIAMMKVVINCLGKIATALEATATFWHEQAERCGILQKMGETLKANLTKLAAKHQILIKKKVINSLRDSGYTWMSLWHMNYYAMQEIEEPYKKATSVVNHFGQEMSIATLKSKARAVGTTLQVEAQAEIKGA